MRSPRPEFTFSIGPPHPSLGRFAALASDRKGGQSRYAQLLSKDPCMRGRVLDVGCGPDFPNVPPVRDVLKSCAQLDGLDPRGVVHAHPALTERWQCTLENAVDVPSGVYDAVFTYNVVEHVRDPSRFLQEAGRVLKPGGSFWAYTPHAVHPFAIISRCVQALSLKNFWRKTTRGHINDYPAYYRLNRRGSVARHARRAGFESVTMDYIPSVQWDTYFAPPLKFLPHLYDRLIGIRVQQASQLLIFHAVKTAGDRVEP